MPTIADICAKFPKVKKDTMRRKLFALASERPELAPLAAVSQGRAINKYTVQQVAYIVDHFKQNPIRSKRGRPALPEKERQARKDERNAARRAAYHAQKGHGHGK